MRRSTTTLVPLLAIAAAVLVASPPAVAAPLPNTDPGATTPTGEVTVGPSAAEAGVGLLDDPVAPAAVGSPTALESPLRASIRLAFATLPASAQARLPQILRNVRLGTP